MAWKRLKTFGKALRCQEVQGQPRLARTGWYEAALISPELLLLPLPEDSLQHYNPVSFELISEAKSSGNQCQAPAGGVAATLELPSEGLMPKERGPHPSTHLTINKPTHTTAPPVTVLGNHGNHSTHQGLAELWATQGDSQFCPFKQHSLLSSLQVAG